MKATLIALAALSLVACNAEVSTFSSSSRGAPIGGACSSDGECAGSATCGKNWPGGYCVMQCTGTPSVCPANSLCAHLAGDSNSYCFDTCSSGSDCRVGYVCSGVSGASAGICLPQ